MDNRPIGVFDSGLGGLTAVRALKRLLPEENIIYFADSGRAPYGEKTIEQLRVMSLQDTDFFARRGVKAILAACGTVSSVGADILERCPLPAIGVLKSTVSAAVNCPPGAIGVIATPASIKSRAFETALREACPEREIIAAPCREFVPLIEGGHYAPEDELIRRAVRLCLAPMKEAGVSVLLLGCTHYGLISQAISDYMGPELRLLEASQCAASALRDILTEKKLLGGSGEDRYYTSGDPAEFTRLASVFLGRELSGKAEYVPPMEIKI